MKEDIKILKEYLDGYSGEIGTRNFNNALENVLKELENKDKVIDEMVNEIFENYQSYEPCPLEDKTKCKIYLKCKECIKQYFIKKVEEQK